MLLDRFPGVPCIHILIRTRKGLGAGERFEKEVLDSPPFQPLVQQYGRDSVLHRVKVLSGDAAQIEAGLGTNQVQDLKGKIGLVINCAGLVEFFPPLDQSLDANVTSIEQLIQFCRQLNARLVHVSTCYVAGEANGLIEETEPIPGFYPRRTGQDDKRFSASDELAECREAVARAAKGLEGAKRTKALVELGRSRSSRWGWVNTYTYSKSLGEQILAAQDDVQYAIVRPAIVESSLRFPFPGWIEGGRTAAPLVLMAMGGLMDWPARRDLSLEVVPVDLIAAATLAVSGKLLAGRARQVYQLASSDVNPYPLEDLIKLLVSDARKKGSGSRINWLDPFPRLRFLNAAQAEERRQLMHRRIRRGRRLLKTLGLGKRTANLRLVELQLGFHQQTFGQYLPFILDNRYVFESCNIRELYQQMSLEDQQKIPWNPELIKWPSYWRDCQSAGIRKWLQPRAVREWSFQL